MYLGSRGVNMEFILFIFSFFTILTEPIDSKERLAELSGKK